MFTVSSTAHFSTGPQNFIVSAVPIAIHKTTRPQCRLYGNLLQHRLHDFDEFKSNRHGFCEKDETSAYINLQPLPLWNHSRVSHGFYYDLVGKRHPPVVQQRGERVLFREVANNDAASQIITW